MGDCDIIVPLLILYVIYRLLKVHDGGLLSRVRVSKRIYRRLLRIARFSRYVNGHRYEGVVAGVALKHFLQMLMARDVTYLGGSQIDVEGSYSWIILFWSIT